MKKIILVAALFIGSVAHSQSDVTATLNFLGGERFSTYSFHNSASEKSKELSYVMHNAFGANLDINVGRSVFRPEVMYYQAGAKTKFNGTKIDWQTAHLALNFAYMYSMVDGNVFSLRPGLGIGINYMLAGEQFIGSSRINIVKEKSLKRMDVEAMAFLNAKFQINPVFSIGAEYRFGHGILQIEGDINQKTRNLGHGIFLNLGFTFGSGFSPRY